MDTRALPADLNIPDATPLFPVAPERSGTALPGQGAEHPGPEIRRPCPEPDIPAVNPAKRMKRAARK